MHLLRPCSLLTNRRLFNILIRKEEMKNNRLQRYVRVDKSFLDLPEVEDTLENLKGIGFAMAVLLLERLQYRKHTIGLIANLGGIARMLGVQKRTLINMLLRCPVFRVDVKHGLFYAPRLRKKYKLSAELTDDEIKDVVSDGNIYYGTGEKCATDNELSEKESKTKSKRFQKSSSQPSDNQEKCGGVYKDIDRDISDRNIDIESNKAFGDKPSCHDDADDAEEFKKILSSDKWRKSVSSRFGINLTDSVTLDRFAEWMAEYCTSMQKHLKNTADVRKYAANLLRSGTKTRAEIDRYLSEHQNVTPPEPKQLPHSEFEFVFNGMRYTRNGQLIPADAPLPTSDTQWYSYLHDRWVERKDYHKDIEESALKRRMHDNPGYVRRIGGASC